VRQTNITPPIKLWPGDTFELTHHLKLNNDYRDVTLVGIRWELVFAEGLSAEDAERIEQAVSAGIL
jgi:hypothetical protein